MNGGHASRRVTYYDSCESFFDDSDRVSFLVFDYNKFLLIVSR